MWKRKPKRWTAAYLESVTDISQPIRELERQKNTLRKRITEQDELIDRLHEMVRDGQNDTRKCLKMLRERDEQIKKRDDWLKERKETIDGYRKIVEGYELMITEHEIQSRPADSELH